MRLPVLHQLRDPLAWASRLQLAKTVAAVVIAWVLADPVLDLSQSFLAPWAALLAAHATVFGSLKHGVQQVGATIVGVLLAFVAGTIFGVSDVHRCRGVRSVFCRPRRKGRRQASR